MMIRPSSTRSASRESGNFRRARGEHARYHDPDDDAQDQTHAIKSEGIPERMASSPNRVAFEEHVRLDVRDV
jgi:hypothetical protein